MARKLAWTVVIGIAVGITLTAAGRAMGPDGGPIYEAGVGGVSTPALLKPKAPNMPSAYHFEGMEARLL